jgi:hypothetical protein
VHWDSFEGTIEGKVTPHRIVIGSPAKIKTLYQFLFHVAGKSQQLKNVWKSADAKNTSRMFL